MTKKEYIERRPIEKFIEDGLNNPDKEKAFGHDAVEILAEISYAPAADVAPVVHGEWISTTKHRWRTKDNGEVDEFAWDREFHNGPVCTICGSAPCVHCRPGWEDDEGCDEHFACSVCGVHEEKKYPYCHCGAKMDGGAENAE